MEDIGLTASTVLFIAMLLIDFFFFGFGRAVRGLNSKEIDRRAEEDGDKKSRRLSEIINRPAIFVNTLQFVVTLANMLVGFCFSHIPWVLAVLFYLVLVFGILLPKKIAALMPEKWAYVFVNPVYYIMILFMPFTWVIAFSVKVILWLFGVRGETDSEDVTEEEIISMVNEGHEQGILEASEAKMINNIFEFGDKEAQDIMTHRNHIVAIDGQMLLSEALRFMLGEHNSRYPVYEDHIDHIIGIIHMKDAMRLQSAADFQDRPVREIPEVMREVTYIPRTRNIDELFKQMQSEKLQMVIVVDEYGQTDGLIAMEDILEEIVGNIMDEYDEDTNYIREKSEDEYIIEGKTPLEELGEKLQISFEDEEFETLNGFLISRMEHIPEDGEEFDVDFSGYHFKLLKVENKMIQSVLVTRQSEPENGAESGNKLEQSRS